MTIKIADKIYRQSLFTYEERTMLAEYCQYFSDTAHADNERDVELAEELAKEFGSSANELRAEAQRQWLGHINKEQA